MLKFLIGTIIKFTIRNLKFLNKMLQGISLLKPIIAFIKNNKTLFKIISYLQIYTLWRTSFKGLRIIGAAFNLFLLILFFDYRGIDLGIPEIIAFFLSILSIFPDIISDFFISMFTKLSGFISRIYNKLKDYLAKLIEYTLEDETKDVDSSKSKDMDSSKSKAKETPKVKDDVSKTTPKIKEDRPKGDWSFPSFKREPVDIEPQDSLRKLYKDATVDPAGTEKTSVWIYIIGGVVVIASGFLVYYYWGNITNLFKKGGEDKGKGRETFTYNPETGDYVSEASSPGKYYPDGYLRYFSRKLGDLSEQVKDRAKELYNSGTSYLPSFSKKPDHNASLEVLNDSISKHTDKFRYVKDDNGFITLEGPSTRTMWNGLPLPRTETIENGEEVYFFMDKEGFVNMINNKIEAEYAEIINPRTNTGIGRRAMSYWDKSKILANRPGYENYYTAPENSYVRFPKTDNVSLWEKPTIGTLDIPEHSLPGSTQSSPIGIPVDAKKLAKSAQDAFAEVDLGTLRPSIKTPVIIIDPDATPKAGNVSLPGPSNWDNRPTKTGGDSDPFGVDFDPFAE